ncbi:MAG TPA: amidohydrolase family protein [Bryobacteraceae bacterium]|nr:amidohydrolase family protein [Bryobacteraceae bacterium]
MNIRAVLAASLCLPAAGFCQSLIRDVRVFDGESVLEHRSVLIEGGKIAHIGGASLKVPAAEIVDGKGRTLLPGLFDAHLHVPQKPEAALRQLAALGVTTALDMFGGGQKLTARLAVESEDPPDMADLRAAGVGAMAPGSALSMMAGRMPTIGGADHARAWVDARIAEGSDYIKVLYDERIGGPLKRETLEAIVAASHARGKLVVAHVLSEEKAREAIAAEVDGLAHLYTGESSSGTFGKFAAGHHVFVIPTLITLYSLCGKPQGAALLADRRLEPYIPPDQQKILNRQPEPERQPLCKAPEDAMRELVQAKVPILAGSDAAPSAQIGAFVMSGYGASLHGELKLMVDCGMTPVQALAAATSGPARAFRFTDRGWIRPGMRADLLLVQGDPTRNILDTRNIVAVWKSGVRIKR